MSKRTGAVPAETRDAILRCARDAFWENGFSGTSLRKVSQKAGVTTGAVYFFFAGKDQLFETVLSCALDPFRKFMEQHYAQERQCADPCHGTDQTADLEVAMILIDAYFESQKTWDIFIRNMTHPAVRSFLDDFIERSTEHYEALISAMDVRNPGVDRYAVHQFVHMQVDTMLNLITHDFDRDQMKLHAETAVRMLKGAFRALITL